MHSAVKAYHKVCTMDLRDRLIIEHLSYVRHILGKLLGSLPEYVDNENLESAGILGLVEAAGQYDPDRGAAFTTFAYQRIRGAILDELRRNCPVPQAILQSWALIRDASVHMTPPLTPENCQHPIIAILRWMRDPTEPKNEWLWPMQSNNSRKRCGWRSQCITWKTCE